MNFIIEKGTKLINERNKEVEVYRIFLEAYLSGYKTIIQVKNEYGSLDRYWGSDLGGRLKLKEDDKE